MRPSQLSTSLKITLLFAYAGDICLTDKVRASIKRIVADSIVDCTFSFSRLCDSTALTYLYSALLYSK
jgi:hypothetical protein